MQDCTITVGRKIADLIERYLNGCVLEDIGIQGTFFFTGHQSAIDEDLFLAYPHLCIAEYSPKHHQVGMKFHLF